MSGPAGPPVTGPDTEGVGRVLEGAAARFGAAAAAARAALPVRAPAAVRSLVVACGPRAAPAGEAFAALAAPVAPVPVQTVDHEHLPGHVGGGCVVLVGALGPEEAAALEPLAAEATGRGASVLCVGAAGFLGPDFAPEPPRPSTPAALAPLLELLPSLLVVAGWVGVLPPALELAEAMEAALSSCGGHPPELGPPGRLARRIGRAVPLFEGAAGVGEVAARAFRRSWNELAKAPAIATAQPSASRAEVAGFGQHGDVTRQLLVLVSLRSPADAPGDRLRSELFAELAGEALADVVEIDATAADPAGALAELCWLGAATAFSRARQEGLDPGPVPAADELEARLAGSRR